MGSSLDLAIVSLRGPLFSPARGANALFEGQAAAGPGRPSRAGNCCVSGQGFACVREIEDAFQGVVSGASLRPVVVPVSGEW